MKILVVFAFCLIAFSGATLAQNKSVYTSTKTNTCRTIESNPDEGSLYEGECKGVGGYKIRLLEGDLRQTLDIVTPSRKKFQLEFWKFFGGFSFIGEKIEWRVKSGVPVALIARLNVSDPEDSTKTSSYLMVSKIGKSSSCVTDIVEPISGQNEKARKLADFAASKPCKANN